MSPQGNTEQHPRVESQEDNTKNNEISVENGSATRSPYEFESTKIPRDEMRLKAPKVQDDGSTLKRNHDKELNATDERLEDLDDAVVNAGVFDDISVSRQPELKLFC